MRTEKINSFEDFIAFIETTGLLGFDINLYRGQSDDSPLLPSIARNDPKNNTTVAEQDMLEDLKRRSQLLITKQFKTDWEWLVLAQHFGLKTRLLDWTSNPLTALWFACNKEYKLKQDSFVYCLSVNNDKLVDIQKNESPFNTSKTKVLRPSLNNERIIAQSGWFTAHKYANKEGKFIRLEWNSDMKDFLVKVVIPTKLKTEFLKKLSIFGINNRTIYPDIAGLCWHLNWKYKDRL